MKDFFYHTERSLPVYVLHAEKCFFNSMNVAAEHESSNFITREPTRGGPAGGLCQGFCLPLACGDPRAQMLLESKEMHFKSLR